MEINLIKLLTDLSNSVLNSSDCTKYLPDKKSFSQAVKRVRKKGFDVIHGFRSDEIDVGPFSNWDPEIFVSDYAYELMNKGANRAAQALFENLNIVCKAQNSHLNEILTLLLSLQGPFQKCKLDKHPFTFSGHDYFLRSHNAFELLPDEIFENDDLPAETLRPESPLMLDYFTEQKSSIVTPTEKYPSLWDFIDGEPPFFKPKFRILKTNPKPPDPKVSIGNSSRWSEIEPLVIDGLDCEDDLCHKQSFTEEYEASLQTVEYGLLTSKAQTPNEYEPSQNLSLSLEMHDKRLSKLCGKEVKIIRPREIKEEDYVQQAKYLLMGFEGDIFKFDIESGCFYLLDGIYINGLSPRSLAESCKNLLVAGKIVKDLKYQSERAVADDVGGFSLVCLAFWKSVQDFLRVHYKEVAAIPNSLLPISFRVRTSKIHAPLAATQRLIERLNKDCNWRCGPLLTYLYDICRSTFTPDIQNILFGILYDCCYVYFSKLVETWMFQGIIDCHIKNDFFVREREDITKDREWDRTYYQSVLLDETAVPSFLKGMAARIFNCGKAIWLLRLCDPENKLIYFLEKHQHPHLRPCTTDDEFSALDGEVLHYETSVIEACGDNTSFVRIRESEQHEEEEKIVQIRAMQVEVEARTEARKIKLLEERRLKIEKEKAFRQEQMEAILLKAARRKEEEIARGKEEKEVDTMNLGRTQIIAEEEKKLKQKYIELAKAAEDTKIHSEWRRQRWELQEKRIEFMKDDILNKSNLLDAEGNLIESHLDLVNANITSISDSQSAFERTKHKNLDSQITFNSEPENINIQHTLRKTVAFRKNTEGTGALWDIPEPTMMEVSPIVETAEFPSDDKSPEEDAASEALKNRMKVMSSGLNEATTEDQEKTATPKLLTEAMKIKMKILNSEYALGEAEEEKGAIKPVFLTEAMKNKLKVLGTEYNLEDVLEENANNPIETEAIRNKLKNIGKTSEFFTEENQIAEGNVEVPKTLTEAMKNKLKVLGVEYNREDLDDQEKLPIVLTEAMRNKLKVLGVEYNREDLEDQEKLPVVLTEAMRNKLKVLGVDHDFTEQNIETFVNEVPKVLTEAMKNKLKVLGVEYNREDSDDEAKSKVTLVLTEAMKNKLKVLGVEYNLIDDVKKDSQMSAEAAANKVKVLGSLINEPIENIADKSNKPLTEAQKNKLKVLGTEFDLPPIEAPIFSHDRPLTAYQKNKQRMFNTVLKDIQGTKSIESPENLIKSSTPLRSEDNDFMTEIASPKIRFDDYGRYSESSAIQPIFEEVTSDVERPSLGNMSLDMFARHLERSLRIAINAQERLANGAVLKYFLINQNLMSHINALRSYFLLYDGEFSRTLSYGLFRFLNECKEPKAFFSRTGLSNILNEALHHSNGLHDNLSFQIVDMPKELNLEVHDTLSPFQLSYKVKWPLNIIITEVTIEKYRKIFHILMNLKRAHWTLNETFLLLKSHTKDNGVDGIKLMHSPEYTKLATYRHAMTLFIMTLEDHMCAEGPILAWNDFLKRLETVKDLDHLYHRYISYVKDICQRCFLMRATQDLLSYIHEMIEIGLRFHYLLKSSTWHLINEQHYSHPKYEQLKDLFVKFCQTTRVFTKTLRKKVREPDMKMHLSVLQLINLKMKVSYD